VCLHSISHSGVCFLPSVGLLFADKMLKNQFSVNV
jgi:hypothetical protein